MTTFIIHCNQRSWAFSWNSNRAIHQILINDEWPLHRWRRWQMCDEVAATTKRQWFTMLHSLASFGIAILQPAMSSSDVILHWQAIDALPSSQPVLYLLPLTSMPDVRPLPTTDHHWRRAIHGWIEICLLLSMMWLSSCVSRRLLPTPMKGKLEASCHQNPVMPSMPFNVWIR